MGRLIKRIKLEIGDEDLYICLDGDVKLVGYFNNLTWTDDDVAALDIDQDMVGKSVFGDNPPIVYSDIRFQSRNF